MPNETNKTVTSSAISLSDGSILNANDLHINSTYAGENPSAINFGKALSYGLYINGSQGSTANQPTQVNLNNAEIIMTNTPDTTQGKFGLAPYLLSGIRVISDNEHKGHAVLKINGKLFINLTDRSNSASGDYMTGIYASGADSKVYLNDSDITIGRSGQYSSALKIGKDRSNGQDGGAIYSQGHMVLDTTAEDSAPTVRLIGNNAKLLADYATSNSQIKSANTAILFGNMDYWDHAEGSNHIVALNNAKITTTAKDKSLILVNAGVKNAKMTLQGQQSEATAGENGWLVEVENPNAWPLNPAHIASLTFSLDDHAVAKGLMNVSGDSTLDVNIQNGAIWQLYAKNDLNEQRTKVSQLNLFNGGVLDASKTINAQNAADYVIEVPVLNNKGGIINLASGNYHNKLTIDGNYFGDQGAKLKINTKWNAPGSINGADSNSDVLNITGQAWGQTQIQPIGADGKENIIDGNIQQAKTQLNTSPVVHVAHSSSTKAFIGEAKTNGAGMAQLTSAYNADGGQDYFWTLQAKNSDSELNQKKDIYAPAVAAYVTMPKVNLEQAYNTIGTQIEHTGQIDTNQQEHTWSRVFGQHLRQNGKTRLNSDTDIYGFQIGHAFLPWQDRNNWKNIVNVYMGYNHANSNFGDQYRAVNGIINNDKYTGKAKADMVNLGISNTFYSSGNSYFDILGQLSYIHNKYEARDDVHHNQNGWGVALSYEMGHELVLSQNKHWVLIPQTQLIYQYINLNHFNDGVRNINQHSQQGLRGRIGTRITYYPDQAKSDHSFYGLVDIWHDFLNSRRVNIGQDSIKENNARSWSEIGIGMKFPINKNGFIYSDARYQHQFGNSKREGWHGNIGFKYFWK